MRSIFICLVVVSACSSPRPDPVPPTEPVHTLDPHSHARPAEVRVEHVSLDLDVDFARRALHGAATLRLQRSVADAPLRLDSAGLDVARVVDADLPQHELKWHYGAQDEVLGREIVIELAAATRAVRIHYATGAEAAALQWLEPAQTAGGERPYLFTQGQAILTRTWIPLQDSPGVRVSYDATIRVERDIGVVPVMSAAVREDLGDGSFRFELAQPIPPYLIALAVGELARREISARCAVWAEPSVVERAAAEFVDTERMIVACEQLFGPYRWGRYDILVLPPSFPFGGMENPCLTFATPTILAGDRSLVALIAHELAHSWSGNLVTNATWRDFWLNEGFTVYLEQRIVEAIFGPDRARMETILGLRQLARELRELPRDDQRLHIDLRGRNPDDGMTAVPYDKGAAFLRRLERAFGRPRFDRFLNEYFDAHAFQSITTEQFLDYLDAHLLASDRAAAAAIDIEEWVRGAGIPADNPRVESAEFDAVDAARAAWLEGGDAGSIATDGWATTHWLHFLAGMPGSLEVDRMADLDAAFALTASGNAEIVAAWLELAIRRGYHVADARLEQFLMTIGRRKFLKPLYEALIETGPAGKRRARAIYEAARPRYHAVSQRTLDAMLGD